MASRLVGQFLPAFGTLRLAFARLGGVEGFRFSRVEQFQGFDVVFPVATSHFQIARHHLDRPARADGLLRHLGASKIEFLREFQTLFRLQQAHLVERRLRPSEVLSLDRLPCGQQVAVRLDLGRQLGDRRGRGQKDEYDNVPENSRHGIFSCSCKVRSDYCRLY